MVSAGAASLIIGRLALFTPAGFGVRKGIRATILSQIVPLQISILTVIAWRLVSVISDFGCGLISAVSIQREGIQK